MKKLLLILSAFSLLSLPAHATILAGFDFDGAEAAASFNATTTSLGVDSSVITRGGGIVARSGNGNNAFQARGVQSGDLANSFAGDEYFTFTLTPTDGFELTVENISFQLYWREGTGNVTLMSSATGFGTLTENILGQGPTGGDFNNPIFNSFDLDTPLVVTEAIEFRLYLHDYSKEVANGFEQIGIGNNEALDGVLDLTITGVIPEPSTYALLIGLAVMGLAIVRRRR